MGGGSLAEELGITDSQRERLRAENEKLQAELREKLAELQEEAQEKLLNVLTAQQRAKFKELVGEPFEFQPMQFGGGPGGGQRGFQPGGRGGFGGAQGRGGQGRPQRPSSGN